MPNTVIIREMQNKTMRSHLILVRMIIIPVRWLLSKAVTNVGGAMERREPHTLVQPLWLKSFLEN